jgi:Uma2 family endonuclease
MAVQQRYTVEDFESFIQLPENSDRLFEFIGGEIVEVPSNPYSSQLASRISGFLFVYLMQNNIAHLTGEAGGYWVSGERYAPDVAVLLRSRQTELVKEGYNPNPPDLAVEVVSPTDDERRLRIKVTNYLAAGTTLWVVYPETKEVEVYASGQPYQVVGVDGTLAAEHILPGFALAVKDIFG